MSNVFDEFYPTVKIYPIKIKYHDPELIKIEQNNNSAWIDLRSAETIEIKQGEHKLISLGVSIKIPDGWEGHLAPRSSTFKNYGLLLTNSLGIIESNYAGNNDIWKMSVYATRDTIVNKNDRICQFRIIEKQPCLKFDEIDDMNEENRGGFGSTGIK